MRGLCARTFGRARTREKCHAMQWNANRFSLETMRRGWVGLLLLLLAPSTVFAGDSAAAQALFDEGKALLAAGKVNEACAKLAESQRIEPSGGTILHLAVCHMQAGKTATAWTELNDAISQARRDGRADREKAAKNYLQQLEPKMVRISIHVADDARVKGLAVTRDGVGLTDSQWDVAVPVDPGEHLVTAAAPGFETWSMNVRVDGGAGSVKVDVPHLRESALPVSPKENTQPVYTPAVTISPPATTTPEPKTSSPLRAIGIAVGGVGLAGVAIGVVTAGMAFGSKSTVDAHCTGSRCDATGFSAQKDAGAFADASTAAFVIGGVCVAAGVVLFLVGKPASRTSAFEPLVVRF